MNYLSWTKFKNNKYFSNGGRVLNVTSLGSDFRYKKKNLKY